MDLLLEENGQKAKMWHEGLFWFSLVSFLILGMIVPIASYLIYSSTDKEYTTSEYFYATIVSGLILISLCVIFVWNYLRFYRTFYHEIEWVPDYEGRVSSPNRCKICKRHPVSKKYHIKNIHKEETGKFEDCFEACNCNVCIAFRYNCC